MERWGRFQLISVVWNGRENPERYAKSPTAQEARVAAAAEMEKSWGN